MAMNFFLLLGILGFGSIVAGLTCKHNITGMEIEDTCDVGDKCVYNLVDRRLQAEWLPYGCGSCKYEQKIHHSAWKTHRFDGCMECDETGCDDGSAEVALYCFDDVHSYGLVDICEPGLNCAIINNRTVTDGPQVVRTCAKCPNETDPLIRCAECNSKACNDFSWPKCWAGAGNALLGDFYMEKECKQNLNGPSKDMKVTANCIKVVEDGVTYKDCGTCDEHSAVGTVPTDNNVMPKGKFGLAERKCFQCEGNLCNQAYHTAPMLVCWQLLIGACLLVMGNLIGF